MEQIGLEEYNVIGQGGMAKLQYRMYSRAVAVETGGGDKPAVRGVQPGG